MKSVCRTETGRDVVPDKELVERSLSGEEDAFRQLYERYRVAVYTAVYRIVRDREEALDLTQEVFIAAFRSLGDWNAERAGFFSWIYKMAVNRAIDGWRKQRRRAEVSLPENWHTGIDREDRAIPGDGSRTAAHSKIDAIPPQAIHCPALLRRVEAQGNRRERKLQTGHG